MKTRILPLVILIVLLCTRSISAQDDHIEGDLSMDVRWELERDVIYHFSVTVHSDQPIEGAVLYVEAGGRPILEEELYVEGELSREFPITISEVGTEFTLFVEVFPPEYLLDFNPENNVFEGEFTFPVREERPNQPGSNQPSQPGTRQPSSGGGGVEVSPWVLLVEPPISTGGACFCA